jgi:two-component system C4-dicarboxylate transport response regulator DctD
MPVPAPLPSTSPPAATVLVVDDDASVRKLLRRILEPAVCRVLEAREGLEALLAIERDDPPLDAVLTDLQMPLISGYEVAAVLAEYRPELPVMILSSELGNATRLPRVRATLTKPIAPNALGAVVRSVLEMSRAQRLRARQQRADAGESRSLASWQRAEAAAMRARNADLVTAALNLRVRGTFR